LKPGRFQIAPEQDGDMTYPLNQFRIQGFADKSYQLGPLFAIFGAHPDLDEFMMADCGIDFIEHRWGETIATHDNVRFSGVSQRFQIAFLGVI
jgi:hypothetical protein